MKEEIGNVECQLMELAPAPLSEALHACLDHAMQQAYQEASLSDELSLEELEQTLGKLAPSGLSHGFLSRMDTAMQEWQEEGEKEAKIVPFSKAEESNLECSMEQKNLGGKRQTRVFWNYASVAAVALFGGLLALTLPEQNQISPGIITQAVEKDKSDRSSASAVASTTIGMGVGGSRAAAPSQLHSVQLTGSSADRNIVGISSEGVRNNHHDQPCRCLKVDYVDVIEMRNSEGKQIKIEEPKVEYLYIPIEEN